MRTATLAYDAVALVAALVKTQGAQRFSEQVLTNPSGFAGIDGLFRFRTDGTNERGLAVMRVDADRRPGHQPAAARLRSLGIVIADFRTLFRRHQRFARLEAVVRGVAASRRGLPREQDQVVGDQPAAIRSSISPRRSRLSAQIARTRAGSRRARRHARAAART